MADALKVERRSLAGKRNNRRLRRGGSVPGVLYGHGEEVLSLTISAHELGAALRHGSRVVHLEGAVTQTAFIREVQWDTYGVDILHIDFARVSEDEKVEVNVPLDLRGEAPGLKQGGVVQHLVHSVTLECPVIRIPEKLFLSINSLQLNESRTLADVELPQGATLIGDPTRVVCACVVPTEQPEETAEAGPAEPELIGRKPAEEEEAEE